MKSKFSLPIFSILLMFIPIFLISISQADIKDNAAKVKICGKVTGEYNKNGLLYITLNKVINERKDTKFSVVAKIDSSGMYCIEAPMGMGNVNLTVFNPPDAASELLRHKVPFTPYSKNPLKIENKDISGIDIVFKSMEKLSVLMETYDGPTVFISGKIFMNNYKEGHIGITANTSEMGPPEINVITIEKPGEYLLEVPKNFGKLYIAAYNVKQGRPQYYKGAYPNNPILVEDKDIKKIDITIGQKAMAR